jgi:hypothetical protein
MLLIWKVCLISQTLDVPRFTTPSQCSVIASLLAELVACILLETYSHHHHQFPLTFLRAPKYLSLLPHTRISAARDVRARVSDDGRERRVAVGMLQDAWLALHIRAHPARGPPTRDERAVCVRAPSELQRRRARRRGHAPRALWPRLVVGARRVAGHARGTGVCACVVLDGGVCALEHLVSRANGGRISEEAVWGRVGCVGGESTIQGDPRRVLMRISIYATQRRARLGLSSLVSYLVCHVSHDG